MKKYKVRIFTLIVLFALVLGAALLSLRPAAWAQAASELRPAAVFSAGTGATVDASEAAEGEDSYVEFTLADGGVVNYRHDLALKWYEKQGEATYFSVTFSLPEIKFETLTLSFESAQENITKDEKTANALIFTAKEGEVTAAVQNGADDPVAYGAVDLSGDVTVSFTSDENGAFDVAVNGTEVGTFTNIGGYFMEYLSSASDTPRIPLSFRAETADGDEQIVLMKSLNGQTFLLEDGMVVDSASPVLVVNEGVRSFALGYKFSLSYQEVDVIDETVTVNREYLMYGAEAEEGEEEPEYKSLTTSTYFLPQSGNSEEEFVSIRFKLTDDRTLTGTEEDEYVYLAWYCPNAVEKDGVYYIPVMRDGNGPEFSCVTSDDDSKTTTLDETNEAYLDYQAQVDEIGKTLNAGEGAYFYLPSLRGLISDDQTDYRNLKFNIYFKNQSSSSSDSVTALSYNALRFEIDEEGEYSFRVTATDKLGNPMKVYEDGQWVSVTSSNVWEIDAIPQFNFFAESTGAVIEDPEEQTIGYLDSIYNVSDFEIIALQGYQASYKLYYFDQDAYVADGNAMPTYSSMVKDPKQIDKKYLVEIEEYDSDVTEDDAAWADTDNDYEWRPTSLSFRPQQAGFYFVEVEVTDAVFWQDKVTAYQVIEVRNPVDVIEGETEWLQNNIVSVILFSVAAVLLVAIIVLWLVKPAEKPVEAPEKKKGGKKE